METPAPAPVLLAETGYAAAMPALFQEDGLLKLPRNRNVMRTMFLSRENGPNMSDLTAARQHESKTRIRTHDRVLSEYQVLYRLSFYTIILALILLGFYLYSIIEHKEETEKFFKYLFSTEQLGAKFRTLILLAPFILTVISYLINDRARILLETLFAERELRTLCDDLILAFANAIDAKSHWTNGHSERVASYALSIGEEMEISESERRTLGIASLLHDIGKIGTYDVILDKPGPLTPEERRLITMHPAQGENILKPIKQLQDVIPIIKCHHERVDGKGYPDGLRGDEIPLLAKILCLADSFDAMIADRPYQKGLDREKAFSEIRNKTGSQFDPDIVRAFFQRFSGSEIPGNAAGTDQANPLGIQHNALL